MQTLPPVDYTRYYQHAELSAHLREVAAVAPERVRLHNLYTTTEGREEWLVEITDFATGNSDEKPAYLVHANLHAVEVSGTTAALTLIDHLLTDSTLQDLLGEVVFYIIPRLNPDGAEYALTTGGQIRSKYTYRPRRNGLVAQDINGDGLILSMRWQDPYGPYRLDDQDPRILVTRRASDSGPFYQMCREGLIEDYDGGPIQDAVRAFDFNRSWAYGWQPEHLQPGAGDYAFSNPEMKAVADWVYAHPAIFGMLGFHNGCNSVLRPSATVPDEDLPPRDLRAIVDLGKIGERLTGFTLRAVRDYRAPDAKPLSLKGHFTDWGYFALGLHVFEIELGNSYNAAGITTEQFFDADERTREVKFMRKVLRYLDGMPEQAFVDWQPVGHPQLGAVEVGGLKSVCWATPPPPLLETIGAACAEFVVEHAQRRPMLEIRDLQAEPVGGGVYRLRGTVVNVGALPTQITQQGLHIQNNRPVMIRLRPSDSVEVLSQESVREVSHLEPLRGRVDVEWFVRSNTANGAVTVEAGSPKTGTVRVALPLTPPSC